MRQIKNNNNNLKSNINLIYFGSGLKNVQLISKILKKNITIMRNYKVISMLSTV